MRTLSALLLWAGAAAICPACSSADASPELSSAAATESRRDTQNDETMKNYSHIDVSGTVRDVVEHPAFAGFGQYVLPLEWGYEPALPLTRIASLLPYHNYVDPELAVGYINQMIDLVNSGHQLYYDLGRKDAGLFFFPGKPGAPFAIFCPGGGFSYVGSIHEGFPLALEASRQGYNAFVIQYSVENGAQSAVEDLAAGIDFIMEHADELNVSRHDYSVWGGSAGARMAAYIGSYSPAAFGAATDARPAAVIMGYTGHSDYTPQDPPTYVVVGANDGIANPGVMRRRVEALQALGIDAEFHIFPNLRHGFGLGVGTSAQGWMDGAIAFWEKFIDQKAGHTDITL